MSIRLDAKVQGSLAARARGRTLVIDAFRSTCCGASAVGGMVVRWAESAPGEGFVAADPLAGVPVAVRASLVPLLETAGPSLHRNGLLRQDGLRLEFDRPELWRDWLARREG